MKNETKFQTIKETIKKLYVGNEEKFTPLQRQRVNVILKSKDAKECTQCLMKEFDFSEAQANTVLYQLGKVLRNILTSYEKEQAKFFAFQSAVQDYYIKNQDQISYQTQQKLKIIFTSNSRTEAINRFVEETGLSNFQSARVRLCIFENQIMGPKEKKDFLTFQKEAIDFYNTNKKSLKRNHSERLKIVINAKTYQECIDLFISQLGMKNESSAKTSLNRMI